MEVGKLNLMNSRTCLHSCHICYRFIETIEILRRLSYETLTVYFCFWILLQLVPILQSLPIYVNFWEI